MLITKDVMYVCVVGGSVYPLLLTRHKGLETR